MKKIINSMICGCVVFALLSCSGYNRLGENDNKLREVYVEKIEVDESIPEGDTLKVMVSGNLPNSAYTFDRFDVEVDGGTIEITPLAEFDSSAVASQALVPFEKVCKVVNLRHGTYEVNVNGKREDIEVKRQGVRITDK